MHSSSKSATAVKRTTEQVGGESGTVANADNINTIMHEGPQRAPLQEWSTEELAARIAAEDAQGLTQQLVANAVTGSDFAALDQDAFVNDLHFTPFAARKLAALREKFLLLGAS